MQACRRRPGFDRRDLCWAFVLDRLSNRFPVFRHLLSPQPLLLVKNGKTIHRHLRREFITEDELRVEIRQQEIEHQAEVKAAYLESKGPVSVMKENANTHPQHHKRQT
jgi:uncharacterized membrane protein YcaP (DUF421 family)